jgi:hypothetical protein
MWTGSISEPCSEGKIMSTSRRNGYLRAAGLTSLIVALLTAGIGRPAHAQGGILGKIKGAAKTIKKKAEQADTTVTRVGGTTKAVECLANDAACAEQPEVQGDSAVTADSGGTPMPSPSAAVTAPVQCESQPRAPPDSSEA